MYTVALGEISNERQTVLRELKGLLDEQKTAAEKANQEERRAGANEEATEEAMDEAQLIERLDMLEALQRKLGDNGTSILDHLKKDSSGQIIKQLRAENAAVEWGNLG